MHRVVADLQVKLVHPLAEIRSRAARTLQFKFKSDLLQLADVVQEESFITSLMEYLSFIVSSSSSSDNVPLSESDVFAVDLVSQLCHIPVAAQFIASVGGVKYLRSLRHDLPASLHAIIDGAIDALSKSVSTNVRPVPAPPVIEPLRSSDNIASSYPPFIKRSHSAESVGALDDLPRLMHSFHIPFEFVHLSPTDEKFVRDFCSIIERAREQPSCYDKYLWGLDVLCADFGSQIFLQRSSLLMSILSGVELCASHRQLSLSAISNIVTSWTRAFRQAADSFPHRNSLTFANNTPDISYAATNVADAFPSNTGEEKQLSLPYACVEIFDHLHVFLKCPDSLHSILYIFYDILPFLRLYVHSVCTLGSSNEHEIDDNGFDLNTFETCMLYFADRLLQAQIHYESLQSCLDSDLIGLFKMQFIISVCNISSDRNHDMSIWPVFAKLIDSGHTDLSGKLVELAFADKSYRAILIFLLQHASANTRRTAAEGIKHFSEISASKKNFLAEADLLYAVVISLSIEGDENVRNALRGVINNLGNLWQKVPQSRAFLPLLQSTYTDDHGDTLNLFIRETSDDLSQSDFLGMALRGLMSRDENYRKYSASLLTEILTTVGQFPANLEIVDDIYNALQFDSSDLADFATSGLSLGSKPAVEDIETLLSKLDACDQHGAKSLVEACFWVTKDPILCQEFVKLGGIASLSYQLSKFAKLAITEMADIVILVLRAIYQSCCVVENVAMELSWNKDLLLGISHIVFTKPKKCRYECARLLTRILFDQHVVTCRLARGPLCDSDNLVFSSLSPISDHHQAMVPSGWASRFALHGSFIRLDSIKLDGSMLNGVVRGGMLDRLDLLVLKSTGQIINEVVQELKAAASHAEFNRAILKLHGILACPRIIEYGICRDIFECLSKFLYVLPACFEDTELLEIVLKVICRSVYHSSIPMESWNLLSTALRKTLVSLLKREFIDNEGGILTEDSPSTILRFIQIFLERAPAFVVSELISTAEILDILQKSCLKCFSSQQSGVADRHKRLACLRSVASLTSTSTVTAFDSKLLSNLGAVITHTLGCLQQSFDSIENFTYQNRSVYRLCALCVRNISRLLVSSSVQVENAEPWLFNDSLDCLLQLLSDDEIDIQSIGLGIIGNLLVIGKAHTLLLQKLPNIFEMALSYATDIDRSSPSRKEAFVILANFIYMSQGRSEAEIFENLQSIMFFDHLKETLNATRMFRGYPQAPMIMMKNLALMYPHLVAKNLLQSDGWHVLAGYLTPQSEICESLLKEDVNSEHPLFHQFRRVQFRSIHGTMIATAQKMCLEIIIILAEDDVTSDYILSNTNIVERAANLLVDMSQSTHSTPDLTLMETILCLFSVLPCREFVSPHLKEKLFDALLVLLADSLSCEGDSMRLLRLFATCLDIIGKSRCVEIWASLSAQNDTVSRVESICDALAKFILTDNTVRIDICQLRGLAVMSRLSKSAARSVLCILEKQLDFLLSEIPELIVSSSKTCSLSISSVVDILAFGSDIVSSTEFSNEQLLVKLFATFRFLISYCNRNARKSVFSEMLLVLQVIDGSCGNIPRHFVILSKNISINKSLCGSSQSLLEDLLATAIVCSDDSSSKSAAVYMQILALIARGISSSPAFGAYFLKLNGVTRLTECRDILAKPKFRAHASSLLIFLEKICKSKNPAGVATSITSVFCAYMMQLLSTLSLQKQFDDPLLIICLCAVRALASNKEFRAMCLANDQFLKSIEVLLQCECGGNALLFEQIVTLVWVFLYDHSKSKAAIRGTRISADIVKTFSSNNIWSGQEAVKVRCSQHMNALRHLGMMNI